MFFSCLSRPAVVGECLLCRFPTDVKLPVCVHALTGRDRGARPPATVPQRPGTVQAVREGKLHRGLTPIAGPGPLSDFSDERSLLRDVKFVWDEGEHIGLWSRSRSLILV